MQNLAQLDSTEIHVFDKIQGEESRFAEWAS
jgi:hypothetical protein